MIEMIFLPSVLYIYVHMYINIHAYRHTNIYVCVCLLYMQAHTKVLKFVGERCIAAYIFLEYKLKIPY